MFVAGSGVIMVSDISEDKSLLDSTESSYKPFLEWQV